MRAAAALLLSASVAIATEGGLSTFSYNDVGQVWEPSALTECFGCATDWINDGECDRLCNKEACGWDGDDCYHNARCVIVGLCCGVCLLVRASERLWKVAQRPSLLLLLPFYRSGHSLMGGGTRACGVGRQGTFARFGP